MEDINKILKDIDSTLDDTFAKTKDLVKENIKVYYEFATKLEKDLANDKVFQNFLKNSTDEQLKNKIDEMSKNMELDPTSFMSAQKEDVTKKSFDAIMSAAIIKGIKEEQERRKKIK